MEYANYHKHDHVSSIFTPDTHIKCEEYVKRAVELGHTTYFTTNHGSGGDIFEAKTLCDKYGLKCIYGIEGYIVPNPLEKDSRNYHIIIIPKTNEARRKVNYISSRANIDGYYYKPRIFPEDLLALEPDDVYITTACIAGLLKDSDSIEQIFMPLYKHFGKNVFLEVQNHKAVDQVEVNRKCLTLAQKYGLNLVAANDSHYIYPQQAADRDLYLKGKKIQYSDEQQFILDYPDYDTFFRRFQEQGVLTDKFIERAIANTMIFAKCEAIDLDKEIKMPSIYQDLTPEERIEELKRHVNKHFKEIVQQEKIPKERIPEYINGIREEMKVIEDTKSINTADYFLFNEKNTDLAVNKYDGVITRTGRGSCGAFYLNKVLGMTQLDRFDSPVTLYPERFMSTARLLENRALPDVDFNCASQEPFQKASKELLGEHGCYPMVAYGTMQESEAFRNVCRSHNLDYNEFNEVAKDIDAYRTDQKWKPYIEEARKFVDTIVSASVHPCAHVLDNKDLRYEYGVIRLGEFLCVMVTSGEADEYKLLKNDYLQVVVWRLISKAFAMIGKPIMSIKELLSNIDDKVWKLYADGITCTLNQCDGEWATKLLQQYKPTSLRELTMFIACIRPSFESWRDIFINRKPYSTGSKQLDEVLNSTNGFILFQENLMQYFDWLGVTPAESIGLIKKISKKKIHQEDFDNLEERLRKQWIINTGSEENFSDTWKMIQSCISYGFASPHALAVAIDSLYGAYLKANYPYEYYTVCFNEYSDNIDKIRKLTSELQYFGIHLETIKFRKSAALFRMDKETQSIYKGIASVKYINSTVSDALYEMRDRKFNDFFDFLEVSPCHSNQLEVLIKLDFFREFGKPNRLMQYVDIYNRYGSRKQIKRDSVDSPEIFEKYCESTAKIYKIKERFGLMRELISRIPAPSEDIVGLLKSQQEYFGYIDYRNPAARGISYVMNVDTKYSPKITLYSLSKGGVFTVKIKKALYIKNSILKDDIIRINKCERKNKLKFSDGDYVPVPNEYDWWLNDYTKVKEIC